MYHLGNFSTANQTLAEFGRRKGSKDRTKRQRKSSPFDNALLGKTTKGKITRGVVGGVSLVGLGTAAYLNRGKIKDSFQNLTNKIYKAGGKQKTDSILNVANKYTKEQKRKQKRGKSLDPIARDISKEWPDING